MRAAGDAGIRITAPGPLGKLRQAGIAALRPATSVNALDTVVQPGFRGLFYRPIVRRFDGRIRALRESPHSCHPPCNRHGDRAKSGLSGPTTIPPAERHLLPGIVERRLLSLVEAVGSAPFSAGGRHRAPGGRLGNAEAEG